MPSGPHACRLLTADRSGGLESAPQRGPGSAQLDVFMDMDNVPGPCLLVLDCQERMQDARCRLQSLSNALLKAHYPHVQEADLSPYWPTSQVQVHYLGSSGLSTFTHLFTNTNPKVPAGSPPRTLAPYRFPSLYYYLLFPCLLCTCTHKSHPVFSNWFSSHKPHKDFAQLPQPTMTL